MKRKGEFSIIARDSVGKVKGIWRFNNLLTLPNQTVISEMLAGTYTGGADALTIAYFAFGTGTNPPTVNDTQLQTEQYRKQVTQISIPIAGTVRSVVSLGSQEANFNIREIGVFAGPTATATANSGTLISRVVVNIEKNSNIVLNVVRNDLVGIN